jgi:mRNA interferase MazF
MTAGRPLARSDIVLVGFPFTDLSTTRVRPALIIGRVAGDDLILAFITSRATGADPRATCRIGPGDAEFARTGLTVESRIRLDRLATLHRRLVLRRLGQIGPTTSAIVDDALRYSLVL